MDTEHARVGRDMAIDLGRIGIWLPASGVDEDLAAEVEALGYGAIWVGGSPPGDLRHVEELLKATSSIAVATGIVNMWNVDPATVAASYHRIAAAHPGRFLLGVGIGHPEATREYRRPYDVIVDYLDQLDQHQVPVAGRALAALGPKVLRLAADRTAGAHPYLTTPEHTKQAREIMGPDALLAPEHKVVVDTNADRARESGRNTVGRYLRLVNYVNNLRRLGYTDDDFDNGGSDRLVDALAPHGDAATLAPAITAHLDAGANHVCVQVLGADPRAGYQELARALF